MPSNLLFVFEVVAQRPGANLCLLLLGFFICDLTFSGFEGSWQLFSKKKERPIENYVADFVMQNSNRHKLSKPKLMLSVC